MAARDAVEPLPACGEGPAPQASPDAELQGLSPTGPLRTPRSGLRQVRVLPPAIAQLWEPLAVNSDSATSVTNLRALGAAQPEGSAVPVLSCPAAGMSGLLRQRQGQKGQEEAAPAPAS